MLDWICSWFLRQCFSWTRTSLKSLPQKTIVPLVKLMKVPELSWLSGERHDRIMIGRVAKKDSVK